MGTFNVEIEIGDAEGRRSDRVEALVDTGSTYLSLPRPLLEALGVVPYTSDRFVFGVEDGDGDQWNCRVQWDSKQRG